MHTESEILETVPKLTFSLSTDFTIVSGISSMVWKFYIFVYQYWGLLRFLVKEILFNILMLKY